MSSFDRWRSVARAHTPAVGIRVLAIHGSPAITHGEILVRAVGRTRSGPHVRTLGFLEFCILGDSEASKWIKASCLPGPRRAGRNSSGRTAGQSVGPTVAGFTRG